MNDIQDGGPAFPVADSHHANGMVQYGCNGMSLRDWFAGQALAGMLTRNNHYTPIATEVAEVYMYADAMLKQRIATTTKETTP